MNALPFIAPHPSSFYVAHRLFTGKPFAAPVWGALTDGPEDFDDVLARLWDMRSENHGELPTMDQVRIWHFQDDVAPRDVTEDLLTVLEDRAEAAA